MFDTAYLCLAASFQNNRTSTLKNYIKHGCLFYKEGSLTWANCLYVHARLGAALSPLLFSWYTNDPPVKLLTFAHGTIVLSNIGL